MTEAPPPTVAARPAGRVLPEAVLGGLALLCLALLPVHVLTVYDNLPAHPLFLHVPVILIPVAAVGAIALAVRPALASRIGVPLGAVAVAALAGTFLAAGAGKALRARLFGGGGAFGGFGGGDARLIAEHAHEATILEIVLFVFVLVLVGLLACERELARPGSFGRLGRALRARWLVLGLRVALVVLAVASVYFVVRTGDLGAKAVWGGRLRGGGGGGFGGGGTGFGPP